MLQRSRGGSVVDFLRPDRSRAGGEAAGVVDEGGTLLDHAELQAEAELGAEIDVGGGERGTGDVGAFGDGGFKGVQNEGQVAVAGHAFFLTRNGDAEGLVGPGGLERARGEEEPAVVGASIGRGWSEAGGREGIGQVGADGGALGDHGVAVADGGHFAHRIDGQVRGRLHGGGVVEDLRAVGLADFLQHPADDAASGLGVGIEDQFFSHGDLLSVGYTGTRQEQGGDSAMPRLLGIDPGLRFTGWGIIEAEGNRLRHVADGVIATDGDLGVPERLKELHDALAALLAEMRPDEAAVEETYVNRNGAATLKLGYARGVALLAPALVGVPVTEYAAKSVKMAVVGTGGADKAQVQMMVRRLLPGATVRRADAADALAVAICHAHHRSSRLAWGVA